MVPSHRYIRGAVILITAFLISSFCIDVGRTQGLTRISFSGGIEEELDDTDGDGSYEYLVLRLRLKVFEPGSYGVHGSIGDGSINSNWGPEDLPLGESEVELKFSGGQISQYDRSGRFDVHIEAYSRDLEMDPISMDHTTKDPYNPDQFEAPSDSLGTFVFARGDSVYIQGGEMTISVNQTYPELSFSYTGDYASSLSQTSILYESLIAFDDNDGDGRWDPARDEKVYEGDLTTVDWELDLDLDVGYDISLHGIIQLRRIDTATVAGWAKVTFRLSSSMLHNSGNIQKFDIDIELWQSLDADRIALMHRLVDETGKQTIISDGEGIDTEDPYALRTLGGDGKPYGVYSWGDQIQVGLLEPDTIVNATTWFAIAEEEALIWFSYPISDDIQFIHHDPRVGMDPDYIPVKEERDDFLDNNLWFMLLGTLLGGLVIGITIYIRVSGRWPGGGV